MNTIRVSNSLDPDQARRFVGPDLGPKCYAQTTLGDKELTIHIGRVFSYLAEAFICNILHARHFSG